MKIKTSEIKTALDNIRPIVGRRQTLPILSCVKLHTERNRLHITASSLDEFICERVEVEGEIEPICVSFNYLSMASFGELTEIKSGKDSILVKCGDNETKIATLNSEEFPALPKMEKAENHGVACADLANAVNQVAWAASDDPSRYVINSVRIQSEAKILSVVATNGRELAIVELPLIGSKFEIIAPSPFASNLCASLSRTGAVLSSNDSQIKVNHDWGNYFCKQLDGTYPNYKQVIPKDSKPLGAVSVEEFLGLVSSCVGYSSDSEAKGVFDFSAKGLAITLAGDNNSTASRRMDGKFATLKIALSTKKMVKIFQHLKTDDAKLFFIDELWPLTIEAGDLKVITTPMRMT